jgi:transposase
MRAYSVDLRERIVAATEQGGSLRSIAQRFRVSAATVCRYTRQKRLRQTLAPKPSPGSKPHLGSATTAALVARVQEKPDRTVSELHAWLTEHYPDVPVSRATVHRALVRAGLTYKKRRWSPPSATTRSGPLGENP